MNTNINKQGVFNTPSFVENPINPYDTNYYIEPDGSVWIRIVHHNNPANSANFFGSTASNFEKPYYINENVWFDVSLCNKITSGKYEFMIKIQETPTSTAYKFRWVQDVNPMIATYSQITADKVTYNTSSGYTNTSYGGLYHRTDLAYTYLCTDSGNEGYWWGAVGAWTQYNGGIPGWYGIIVTTGYQDLYLRINNNYDNNFAIFNKDIIIANNLYEI